MTNPPKRSAAEGRLCSLFQLHIIYANLQDLDDAIHVDDLPAKNQIEACHNDMAVCFGIQRLQVGVHIADVGHFLKHLEADWRHVVRGVFLPPFVRELPTPSKRNPVQRPPPGVHQPRLGTVTDSEAQRPGLTELEAPWA